MTTLRDKIFETCQDLIKEKEIGLGKGQSKGQGQHWRQGKGIRICKNKVTWIIGINW